jgi:hypothetical protein
VQQPSLRFASAQSPDPPEAKPSLRFASAQSPDPPEAKLSLRFASAQSPDPPEAKLRLHCWITGMIMGLITPLLAGASCRATPTECKHDSSERCRWEHGIVAPEDGIAELDGGEPGGDPDGPTVHERAELDHALTSVIEIMQGGLEWPLVDQRARSLCSQVDAEGVLSVAAISLADEAGLAWSCPIANVSLEDQSLTLEASQGVISLTASELDATRSEQLAERARSRFAHKCLGEFEELKGAKLEVFHRCALPEGPYLVVSRFPDDLEADLWQVSISVVDAA